MQCLFFHRHRGKRLLFRQLNSGSGWIGPKFSPAASHNGSHFVFSARKVQDRAASTYSSSHRSDCPGNRIQDTIRWNLPGFHSGTFEILQYRFIWSNTTIKPVVQSYLLTNCKERRHILLATSSQPSAIFSLDYFAYNNGFYLRVATATPLGYHGRIIKWT